MIILDSTIQPNNPVLNNIIIKRHKIIGMPAIIEIITILSLFLLSTTY